MKRYEARLAHDLNAIQTRVAGIADAVRSAVNEAVIGLETFDKGRLYDVILNDHPINRESRTIDTMCHAFVARHLPAAGPLRFVSAVLRLNIGLERIGDYAVTIGRVGAQLDQPIPAPLMADIRELADQTIHMLRTATRAFLEEDADLARETKPIAKDIDVIYDRMFHNIVSADDGRPRSQVVRILTILDQIERVSDQAKNICEEAVFVATGETKKPKVYKVLFVDRTGGLVSQLAKAIAIKAFPDSGIFHAAGWEPVEDLSPALARISNKLALDIEDAKVRAFGELTRSPAKYHVIVTLVPTDDTVLPDIPFHSILQKWNLGPRPTGDDAAVDARLDDLSRDLRAHIRDLMVTLRGEDAS
jgi:phosphate transport system protein